MDKIEISDDQVIALDNIAPGLRGLRIAFVNVFGVTHPDGTWTLIDSGMPHSSTRIRAWADASFGRHPNAIVLTHGHFDHAGSAAELADGWDCPIFAHALEFPYLTGQQEYDGPNWKAGGGLMSLLSPLYPKGPIQLGNRLKALPAQDGEPQGDFGNGSGSLGPSQTGSQPHSQSLDQLPGWTLLHTPGHTPGHVSFFRESDRTLLVGDAFCTTKPESFFDAALTQTPELHGPPSYFTSNWSDARASVEKLARLNPLTVAVGHGKPLAGEAVPERLQRLAEEFDRVAVPDDVKS